MQAISNLWSRFRSWPFRKRLRVTQQEVIIEAARQLGIADPRWLDGLIAMESGHDPRIVAHYPYNQSRLDKGVDTVPLYAKGLIQFIDSTAKALGFADSTDLVTKLPDYESQMFGAVVPYLKQYAPFPTEQSLYLAVFYPAYRDKPANTLFPDSVRTANPGINTPADYVALVNKRVEQSRLIQTAVKTASIGLYLVLGAVIYFFVLKRG
jgi:hypothetical protein